MAAFSKFLKSIYRDGNDGKQFERFVKWFLTHDPEWKTQVDEVWLWDDWPGKWGIDKGIDLVFKHRNGETWAVQAKCYAQKYDITKPDIDKFLSESNRKAISKRLLIATTDKMGANAKDVCAGQEKPVTHFLLSDFEKAAIDYPSDYKHLRSTKPKDKPTSRPYQDAAISDVVKGFKTDDRGQLIMACGTGKTFTTLWIKEKLKSKTTLVLLPSLNLLAQTVREWAFASKSRIEILCVCSDQTVGRRRDEDEVIQSVSDVPFPVQSDIKEIRKFLKRPGDKVIFSTYQSSDLVSEAQMGRGLEPFDLVVADEAHRCAISGKPGSPFATVLDGKRIKAKKRLFATATPRTYTKAVMTAAEGRGVEVVGMDDEVVFGRQFHTLTFGEAIKRKPPLLTDYQVVIIGVDNAMIAEWIEKREIVTTETGDVETDAEALAAQIGLLKAIKDYKLKRVISFHSRVKRAQNFAEDICAAAEVVGKRHLPKGTIHADFVSGKMSTSDRTDKLKRLKRTGPKEVSLLANARCLSEGVDVPSLDGVAFVDPKNSQVDIIQAVGRAIRLSKNKTVGTIVLPVFIQDGDDAETRIEESNFQPIWWVLNALKAHDKVLVDELDAIRTDMGKRGSSAAGSGSIPKVVLDLPVTAGKSFADALKTHLVVRTTASWDFCYGLLQRFISKEGDALVPARYRTPDGNSLGKWVSHQRQEKGEMSQDRREQLEALSGWVWDVADFQWEQGFKYLQQYVAENGDALVPKSFKTPDGYSLGAWVGEQRKKIKTLSKERRERLEALNGWVWDLLSSQWEEGFKYLQEFVAENGDALVPNRFRTTDGYNLGAWVNTQKINIETIFQDRRERLEALSGWVWDLLSYKWEQGFKYFQQYVAEYGDGLVSANYRTPDGYFLGKWVSHNRAKENEMSKDRRERLEALNGWIWDADKFRWEQGFKYFQQYVADYGDGLVPARYRTSDGYRLGAWISQLRVKKDDMPQERRERLEALSGWVWDVLSYKWEQGFKYLQQYVKDEGDAHVHAHHNTSDGFNLGNWVANQRANRDKLSQDRREQLEALSGWVWDVADFQWEQGFKYLQQYVAENGDALVPKSFKTPDGYSLGKWVGHQRPKKDNLSKDQRERFEALNGWVWSVRK